MEKNKDISTIPIYDIYLAAFLSLNNLAPELSIQGNSNRVIFLFPAGEEFNKLSRLFSENKLIPVLGFVQELRKLRSKMLNFKEEFEYMPGGTR